MFGYKSVTSVNVTHDSPHCKFKCKLARENRPGPAPEATSRIARSPDSFAQHHPGARPLELAEARRGRIVLSPARLGGAPYR